jgi:DNA-directed RNA polymerase subunit M/transcription elongation factor TFIIS
VHLALATAFRFGLSYCSAQALKLARSIKRGKFCQEREMAKIAKTADRKKVMDTSKSTDCPKCGKPTRIVKRVKDRERNVPGGMYISCSACEFYEKL